MTNFDSFIADYLYEFKELSLEKIGLLKTTGLTAGSDNHAVAVDFYPDKKVVTTPELINFIAARTSKSKMLVASDIQSHLLQARSYINIGKSLEIVNAGFIKANKTGNYEFVPYSEVNRPVKVAVQTNGRQKRSGNTVIQLVTFIIILLILAGIGWQAYQFFTKPKNNNVVAAGEGAPAQTDTVRNINAVAKPDTTAAVKKLVTYSDSDTITARYIFENTASHLRAQTRTAQLKSFGNAAGFDSAVNKSGVEIYSLYLVKQTLISDTLSIKDSLSKFLQEDIKIEPEPNP